MTPEEEKARTAANLKAASAVVGANSGANFELGDQAREKTGAYQAVMADAEGALAKGNLSLEHVRNYNNAKLAKAEVAAGEQAARGGVETADAQEDAVAE